MSPASTIKGRKEVDVQNLQITPKPGHSAAPIPTRKLSRYKVTTSGPPAGTDARETAPDTKWPPTAPRHQWAADERIQQRTLRSRIG